MDEIIREGNVLRKQERSDENLTTADIANPDLGKRGPESVTQRVGDAKDAAREERDRLASQGDNRTNSSDLAQPNQAAQRAATSESHDSPLFPENELNDFRGRWDRVQAGFVDEPRSAVAQADSLVASVVKRIAEQFANERSTLEKQWDRGDNVSTEDLRQALRRYRAFFDRLLSF
ncbi:MAG: hypothetical protein NVS9B15_20040 [Acidobacteriaceae bacterium]